MVAPALPPPPRPHQGQRHLQRLRVRPAVDVVVQVVKLADMGVAGVQQLGIDKGRDGLELLRRDAIRRAVHAVAPAPEVVLAAVAALGQPGDGPLEGVAVGIYQAGQHGPRQALCAALRFAWGVGHDVAPQAVGTDREQYVLRPIAVDPGGGRQISLLFSAHASPGRPRARRSSFPQVPAGRGWRNLPDTRRAAAHSCTGFGTSPAAPHAHAAPDPRNAG
jgi:hypothetical protein